ncbi:MAG TPA: zinc metalloprotease HtpX [Hyphomicrobiales bacterium]|nr:zinc metalloprotease HtpX [Hyphomicrobiales bacterium]
MISQIYSVSDPTSRFSNVLHSVMLVGGIGLIMSFSAWLLFGKSGVVWAFVMIAVLLLISPRIAPEIIVRMYGARKVHPQYGAPVLRVMEELARRADLPAVPHLYVIPSPVINAFATGVKSGALIVVTQGMLNKLTARELMGVLAHEMSHIRNNDLWIMSLADTMSRFTYFMALMAIAIAMISVPIALFGGPPVPLLSILVLYFAPTVSSLLQLGLSRAREYDADHIGAELTGDPEGLASALHKIESYQGRILETIFIPGRNMPVPSVLRTHPSTEERIKRLLAMRDYTSAPVETPGLETVPLHFVPRRQRARYHLNGLWY